MTVFLLLDGIAFVAHSVGFGRLKIKTEIYHFQVCMG